MARGSRGGGASPGLGGSGPTLWQLPPLPSLQAQRSPPNMPIGRCQCDRPACRHFMGFVHLQRDLPRRLRESKARQGKAAVGGGIMGIGTRASSNITGAGGGLRIWARVYKSPLHPPTPGRGGLGEFQKKVLHARKPCGNLLPGAGWGGGGRWRGVSRQGFWGMGFG